MGRWAKLTMSLQSLISPTVVAALVGTLLRRVSTKLRGLRQREALLALGWLVFLGTVLWLVTSPVRISV